MGYETVMVNCNPETVSTDYSTSDRLYFEPLTPEDVAEVIAAERAACVDGARVLGVIVSLGGQTPLKLSHSLDPALVLGTPVASIDSAEDREQWSAICRSLGLRQPPGDVALTLNDARAIVREIGYPVLVRPSYVLGGRAMEIVYDDASLERVMKDLTSLHGSLAREGGVSQSRPILIDSFLEDAIEVDVDAVRDTPGDVYVAGVMEHVEEAGVHSGDSACALPPQTLSDAVLVTLHAHTREDRRGAGRRRSDQRAVRRQGRGGLRPRGQSPRVAHGALRRQGDRRRPGPGRGSRHDGPDAARVDRTRCRPRRDAGAGLRVGEGGGAPVQPLSRRRYRARSRDAFDRRSHGRGGEFRHRLRQGPVGRGHAPARPGTGLHEPRRPGQGARTRARATPRGPRLHHRRDGRDGGLSARATGSRSPRSWARSVSRRWAWTPCR